jgi:hypothetical protein
MAGGERKQKDDPDAKDCVPQQLGL